MVAGWAFFQRRYASLAVGAAVVVTLATAFVVAITDPAVRWAMTAPWRDRRLLPRGARLRRRVPSVEPRRAHRAREAPRHRHPAAGDVVPERRAGRPARDGDRGLPASAVALRADRDADAPRADDPAGHDRRRRHPRADELPELLGRGEDHDREHHRDHGAVAADDLAVPGDRRRARPDRGGAPRAAADRRDRRDRRGGADDLLGRAGTARRERAIPTATRWGAGRSTATLDTSDDVGRG